MGVIRGLGIFGIVLGIAIIVIVGVVAWKVVPDIIDKKIKEETRLITQSETWDKWVDISIPMRLKFYIFNITNPESMIDYTHPNNSNSGVMTEKLNFEEKGPYVYSEHRTKIDVGIGEDGKVIYRQNIEYFFLQEESNGFEDDLFNIPNIPLISVATAGYSKKEGFELSKLEALIDNIASSINPKRGEQIIRLDVPVRELLFDGFKLHGAYKLIPPEDMPPDFVGNTFGLYKGKNNSNDGEYVIKSGYDRHEEFGQIVSWTEPGTNESLNDLEWWYPFNQTEEQTFCNKINGSDGSLFPPFNKKDTTLRLFQTDVCRSLYLQYSEEMEFENIPGYKFTVPEYLFESPTVNQDNQCFCPHPSPKYPDRLAHQCLKGVIRIFPCKHGAPIITSNPHFFQADPKIFDAIQIQSDLQANEKDHTTFIEIEPDSGMLLRASKKVQISVELQPIPNMIMFEYLNFSALTDSPSILLPVIWADETAQLDEKTAKDLYDKLIKPQKTVNIVKWVMLVLGALVVLLGVVGVWKG